MSKIHAFVAQMPLAGSQYSAQSMLKGLHSTCMNLETLDKQQADTALREAHFPLRKYYKILRLQ